jgi:site-specific DNA-methyltransferase (adenine-specific)
MAINLHLGDCLEAMRDMEDNAFDLAIVDPPYGLGIAKDFHQNGERNCRGWGEYSKKEWDSSIPDAEYFSELFRVSKNQIIWGGNYFTTHLPPSQGWVIWNKGQRDFTLADGEMAWTSFDRALRIFDFARGSALSSNQKTGGMWHPTKKPVQLYTWLLSKYAQEGDRILDTHLGSGSIAIAAHNLGFDLTGYELDEEYYQAACNRLKEHQKQLRLF